MTPVKKIEIIIDKLNLNEVTKILDDLDVSGYSVIRGVLGSGHRGPRLEIQEDGHHNCYVMTVCPMTRVQMVTNALTPILKEHGGMCLVSDSFWVAH